MMKSSINRLVMMCVAAAFVSGCSYFKEPLPSTNIKMKDVADESYSTLKSSTKELKEAFLSTKAERDAAKGIKPKAKAKVIAKEKMKEVAK